MIEIPTVSTHDYMPRGTLARDLAIASLARAAESQGGGLLAWYGRPPHKQPRKNPRGRGAIIWVPDQSEARTLADSAAHEFILAIEKIHQRSQAEKPKSGLIVRVAETSGVTVSGSSAWNVRTMDMSKTLAWSSTVAHSLREDARSEYKIKLKMIGGDELVSESDSPLQGAGAARALGLDKERVQSAAEQDEKYRENLRAISAESARVEATVRANPSSSWRIRVLSGVNRRATWYSSNSETRIQTHLGDVLFVAWPTEPEVRPAPRRKSRPKADYPLELWGFQAKEIPQ